MIPAEYDRILSSLVEAGMRTDKAMSRAWLLPPIASLVTWTLVGTIIVGRQPSAYAASTFLLWVLVTIGLATSAGTGYIVYAIVDRRNKHFGRDKTLLATSIENLLVKTRPDDMKTLINASSAEREFSTMIREDRERSGILWGLLAMVPYVGFLFTIIVLLLVSGDYGKHSRIENIVLEDIDNTVKSAGLQTIFRDPMRQTIADVSELVLVTSIVLSIAFAYSFILLSLAGSGVAPVIVAIGLGALSIVIIYSALESPVAHFKTHQAVDIGLLQSITS